MPKTAQPLVAIACGGTGGHLFPGLAIGEVLRDRGCEILLLISPKEIDQQAVKSARGMEVCTLPAVGLSRGHLFQSLFGFCHSFGAVRKLFQARPPQAVLSMGGFTSLAPVLAGKMSGAATFLHESNTMPGKANRWLSHVVDQAFIGFPSAARRLSTRTVITTGTPVRSQFEPGDAFSARMALGLEPKRPVFLVMGGSQGAARLNDLIGESLAQLNQMAPELQYLHLTGEKDLKKVQALYATQNCSAVVRPFLTEMELGMAAATVALCRAGASTLAELAAMRLPAILIPYPTAADNHQYTNGLALAEAGAAWLMEEREATAARLAELVLRIYGDEALQARMKEELVRWHSPRAAEEMAERMLVFLGSLNPGLKPSNPLEPTRKNGPVASLKKAHPPSVPA